MKSIYQSFLQAPLLVKADDILNHSRFSASIVTNLINDLLDLAKFEAKSFSFNLDYFNLVETIEEAFNQIRFMANKKDIALIRSVQNVFEISVKDTFCHPMVT